jgi:DNA-binding beta-propeller fold protein YncE
VPIGGGVATPRCLPHSIAFDPDGKLYVADRSNKRIQMFSADGDFLGQGTGTGGPNDITRGKDGNFYIAEQEDDGKPARPCLRPRCERSGARPNGKPLRPRRRRRFEGRLLRRT